MSISLYVKVTVFDIVWLVKLTNTHNIPKTSIVCILFIFVISLSMISGVKCYFYFLFDSNSSLPCSVFLTV